jgi:hypothetical protein
MSEGEPGFDEFAIPEYSVLGKEADGLEIVTNVVLDGELQEFRIPKAVYEACKKLEG